MTYISLDYSIVDYCAILLFPTIFFFSLYIPTKSFKVKN